MPTWFSFVTRQRHALPVVAILVVLPRGTVHEARMGITMFHARYPRLPQVCALCAESEEIIKTGEPFAFS
jgi:hypothetical protein